MLINYGKNMINNKDLYLDRDRMKNILLIGKNKENNYLFIRNEILQLSIESKNKIFMITYNEKLIELTNICKNVYVNEFQLEDIFTDIDNFLKTKNKIYIFIDDIYLLSEKMFNKLEKYMEMNIDNLYINICLTSISVRKERVKKYVNTIVYTSFDYEMEYSVNQNKLIKYYIENKNKIMYFNKEKLFFPIK